MRRPRGRWHYYQLAEDKTRSKTEIIIAIIGSVLASGGLWTTIQFFIQRHMNKDDTQTKALKALLHDRIYDECKKAIQDKHITTEDYDNLRYLYEPYIALGGNGTCRRLMSEVDKLEIIPDPDQGRAQKQDK